jgi:pilus assembly protein CpaC
LSATISNLFPKLNAAKSAGYARTIHSGMVIVRDGFEQGGRISKKTVIPYAIGSGEFVKATQAEIGLNLDVKPKILEQEKIELGLVIDVSIQIPSGNSAPVVTNNSLNSNVILKSNESAAIGGIVQNTSATEYDNTGNDPAPSSNIPLFRLYRSKSYSTNKSQYVVFVTPEIIESAAAGMDEIRKKFRRRE